MNVCPGCRRRPLEPGEKLCPSCKSEDDHEKKGDWVAAAVGALIGFLAVILTGGRGKGA